MKRESTSKEEEIFQRIQINLELINAAVLAVENQAVVLGKRIPLVYCKESFYEELEKLKSNFEKLLSLVDPS